MATITISISGTDGFATTKSYATDDASIAPLLAAFITDPSITSSRAADGSELPRDAAWAVDAWISRVIQAAVDKALLYQQSQAAAAAIAAVPPIVMTQG
jgi:hypothetical protein